MGQPSVRESVQDHSKSSKVGWLGGAETLIGKRMFLLDVVKGQSKR